MPTDGHQSKEVGGTVCRREIRPEEKNLMTIIYLGTLEELTSGTVVGQTVFG